MYIEYYTHSNKRVVRKIAIAITMARAYTAPGILRPPGIGGKIYHTPGSPGIFGDFRFNQKMKKIITQFLYNSLINISASLKLNSSNFSCHNLCILLAGHDFIILISPKLNVRSSLVCTFTFIYR